MKKDDTGFELTDEMKYDAKRHPRHLCIVNKLFSETGPGGVTDFTDTFEHIVKGRKTDNVRWIYFKGLWYWVNAQEYDLLNYILDRFGHVSRNYSRVKNVTTYKYQCK